MELPGAGLSAPSSTGLSLNLGTKAPADFQITGYEGTGITIPSQWRVKLNELAAAMRSNTDITVDLISYAQAAEGMKARTLSGPRAVEVRRYLISQGVAQDRISVSARGDGNGSVSDNRVDVQVAS